MSLKHPQWFTTASFDVDAQNGFTPRCPDELPVKDGEAIAPALNQQAKLAAYRIGSKDCHPPNAFWHTNDPSRIGMETPYPEYPHYWPPHCIVGTEGSYLMDGLPEVTDYDFFVFKGTEPDMHPYGACYHDNAETLSTGVIEFLQSKSVSLVIVGGLALDYCVFTTAKQLKAAGFRVFVNLDATRPVDESMENATITRLKNLGISVGTMEDIKAYLFR